MPCAGTHHLHTPTFTHSHIHKFTHFSNVRYLHFTPLSGS